MLNSDAIYQIFATLDQSIQSPKTELIYNSPFELLIAVILSAQATDISVNAVTPTLFKIANTPETMLKLSIEELEDYIKTIGLYRSKAKNILKTCELLINNFDSKIPNNFNDLISLAGVGRKTANVVLNVIFNQPTIAVDTHVFRTSRRIGLSTGTTVKQVEEDLIKVIPNEFKMNAHHYLILHGRYTCTARKAKCSDCKIKSWCKKNNVSA